MSKKTLILIFSILAVVLVIGVSVYRTVTFRVAGVYPKGSVVTTATPYVEVSFNKNVTARTFTKAILKDASAVTSVEEASPKKVRFILKPLNKNQRYTLVLQNVEAESGQKIPVVTVSFLAQNLDFDSLPANQKQVILDYQQAHKGILNDPILKHVPYRGSAFYLTANVDSKDSLTLNAELDLTAADQSDPIYAVNAYKSDVQKYISSLGLDPTKYTITYQVVNTSPGGGGHLY